MVVDYDIITTNNAGVDQSVAQSIHKLAGGDVVDYNGDPASVNNTAVTVTSPDGKTSK